MPEKLNNQTTEICLLDFDSTELQSILDNGELSSLLASYKDKIINRDIETLLVLWEHGFELRRDDNDEAGEKKKAAWTLTVPLALSGAIHEFVEKLCDNRLENLYESG